MNSIHNSTYGNEVPSIFKISPSQENGLQSEVTIGYAPTWSYVSVYSGSDGLTRHQLPITPLLEAGSRRTRTRRRSELRDNITAISAGLPVSPTPLYRAKAAKKI